MTSGWFLPIAKGPCNDQSLAATGVVTTDAELLAMIGNTPSNAEADARGDSLLPPCRKR